MLAPDIPLNDLIEYIEVATNRFYNPRTIFGGVAFEIELAIAVYLNKKELYDDTWKRITEKCAKMDAKYKARMIISIDEWKESMHSQFDNRDKFMETVEWNYQRPRVAKLNTANITRVDEYTEYIPKLSWRERLHSFFSR